MLHRLRDQFNDSLLHASLHGAGGKKNGNNWVSLGRRGAEGCILLSELILLRCANLPSSSHTPLWRASASHTEQAEWSFNTLTSATAPSWTASSTSHTHMWTYGCTRCTHALALAHTLIFVALRQPSPLSPLHPLLPIAAASFQERCTQLYYTHPSLPPSLLHLCSSTIKRLLSAVLWACLLFLILRRS